MNQPDLHAFSVYEPNDAVLIVQASGGVWQMPRTRFLGNSPRRWVKARQKRRLDSVRHVEFDPNEPRCRMGTDCVGSPVLFVGLPFVLEVLTTGPDCDDEPVYERLKRLFRYSSHTEEATDAAIDAVLRAGGTVEV